jgi:hypothetical protein
MNQILKNDPTISFDPEFDCLYDVHRDPFRPRKLSEIRSFLTIRKHFEVIGDAIHKNMKSHSNGEN